MTFKNLVNRFVEERILRIFVTWSIEKNIFMWERHRVPNNSFFLFKNKKQNQKLFWWMEYRHIAMMLKVKTYHNMILTIWGSGPLFYLSTLLVWLKVFFQLSTPWVYTFINVLAKNSQMTSIETRIYTFTYKHSQDMCLLCMLVNEQVILSKPCLILFQLSILC